MPDIKSITGPLADFIVTEIDANKPAALALITTAEGTVEAAIVKLLHNLPKPAGILGIVLPAIEGYLEKYAAQLVATYGPEIIFTLLDKEIHAFAVELGG